MAPYGGSWQMLVAVAQEAAAPWWETAAAILAVPVTLVGAVYTVLLIRKVLLDKKKLELDLRSSSPSLKFRYLICKDPAIVKEIATDDFDLLPVKGSMLHRTPTGRFLEALVKELPDPNSEPEARGQPQRYESLDDYARLHPDGKLRAERDPDRFPYFEAVRVPSADELAAGPARWNSLVEALLAAGAPPSEIAYALLLERGCGPLGWHEIYEPRSLWAVYLEVTNTSSRPVVMESLRYVADQPDGVGYRSIRSSLTGDERELSFSNAPLDPGGSVVIPVAAVLPPLVPGQYEETVEKVEDLDRGRWQALARSDLAPAEEGSSVLGPVIWPRRVMVTGEDGPVEIEVHELDLANAYVLSRGWSIGSCPHLFYEDAAGSVSYRGELFDDRLGVTQQHLLLIEEGIRRLIVAELEDETTTVEALDVDGVRVLTGVTLRKGEEIQVAVFCGNRVLIRGFYEGESPSRSQPWRRNEIIVGYLTRSIKDPLSAEQIPPDIGRLQQVPGHNE